MRAHQVNAVFDHAVIEVGDALDEAAAACEQLGFFVTPPSENALGSINRLCVFGNTYLELIPAGGDGLVFRSDHAAATARVELPGGSPLRSYFCHHDTPELIRRPEWSEHPNGALDIVGVTVVAQNPAALGTWFAQAFEGVEQRSDHWLLDAEHAWIDIRSVDSFEDAFGYRPAPDGRLAAIHALTIATADAKRSIVLPVPAINVAIEFT